MTTICRKNLHMKKMASTLLAVMSFCSVQAHALDKPLDSDKDGLPDSVELAHNLDPFSRDSDVDGLSDYDEFSQLNTFSFSVTDGSTSPVNLSQSVADAPDTDGDGINDFMESFGFQIVDDAPSLVPRRITINEWLALKSDETEFEGLRVFDIALSQLEKDKLARVDPDDESFMLLKLNGAKNAIIGAYIESGLSPSSLAIDGLTDEAGSAANIVKTLLAFNLHQTFDEDGKARPIYFTHPKKISTDHDPYTDLQEILGVFPAGRPLPPADHPLIAAAPALRATLEEFDVIIVEQNRNTLGEREGQVTGKTTSNNRSQSHGFSVALKVEKDFSATPGVKTSIELKQSNTWSFGSSTAINQQNSFSTYTQNSKSSQSDCFAKLDLSLGVENTGNANASNISLAFNVYLGHSAQPWQTFSLDSSDFGNLSLAPGQKQAVAALRDGEQACLTIDETNYLAQGGVISVETVVADATVDFFDAGNNLIDQGGSWIVYKRLIEEGLAMMNVDVNATDGDQVNQSFYYVAAQSDHPQLRLSIEDVLAIAFEKKECTQNLEPDSRCYLTPDRKEIVLGDNTFFDMVFYDGLGSSLPLFAMEDKFRTLKPIDSDDIFQKQLTKRSSVTIINNDFEAPQFTHIEVVNRIRADVDSVPDVEVRASASDFFGIDEVAFCFDVGECVAMTNVIDGPNLISRSGLFTITLPSYSFTGNEFLKARNIVGNESQNQSPKAFFLILHENVESQLDEYSQHLRDTELLIDGLSKLQTDSPARYLELVNAGFINTVADAQSKLDTLKEAEQSVQSHCALILTNGAEQGGSEFAAQFNDCQSEVLKFSVNIQNSNIKAFNAATLPGAHFRQGLVGRTKAGEDRPGVGDDELHRTCSLSDNQYAVGLGMSKKNDTSTPVDMTIEYVEFDPVEQTLSARKKKICGTSAVERSNTLSVSRGELSAELILDVGIDMRDSITKRVGGKPRGSARYVSKLCVTFRSFNFATGQWQGDRKTKCNDKLVNSFSGHVHLETGMAALNNSSMALKGLSLYHVETRYTSDERDLFGTHTRLDRVSTQSPPFETLSEFTDYALVNEATGEMLTVKSTSSNSAALGMDAIIGDDTQTWKIERINDRSMRLIPKAFAEGVLVRNSGFEPSVAKLKGNDAIKANYLQHFSIKKILHSKQSAYVISSVIDDRVLGLKSGELVWQKAKTLSAVNAAQRWYFMPLRNEPTIAQSTLQTKVVTSSTKGGFRNSCQVFDLGGDYHVKKITIKGKQDTFNKSLRMVRLNPSDGFSLFIFPPNGNFKTTKSLGVMSSATRKIEVCNQFLADTSSTGSAFIDGNKVNSIEVLALPANVPRFE